MLSFHFTHTLNVKFSHFKKLNKKRIILQFLLYNIYIFLKTIHHLVVCLTNLEAPSVVDQWCPMLYWATEKAVCLLFVGFWSFGQKVSFRDEIKYFTRQQVIFPPVCIHQHCPAAAVAPQALLWACSCTLNFDNEQKVILKCNKCDKEVIADYL